MQQALIERTARNAASARPVSSWRWPPSARAANPRRTHLFTRRWPAISAAAPAIGRSSRRATRRRRAARPVRDRGAARRRNARRTACGATTMHTMANLSRAALARGAAGSAQRHPDAPLHAGGTDLGLRVSKDREALPRVISTALVPELQALVSDARQHRDRRGRDLYAALPHRDTHFPAFGAMMRRIGSRQIRNLGTFAGNLATASPIGDTLPCLLALEASVMLRLTCRQRAGCRSSDFITRLSQDRAAARRSHRGDPDSRSCPKAAVRRLQALEAVRPGYLDRGRGVQSRARRRHRRDVRAAYGGMAATPQRAAPLEAALAGRAWTPIASDR